MLDPALLALRGQVIALAWLGYGGLVWAGIAFNGWRSTFDASTPWSARLCIIAATTGIAGLCLTLVTSPRARDILLAPHRKDDYAPGPFLVVAGLITFMGVYMLVGGG